MNTTAVFISVIHMAGALSACIFGTLPRSNPIQRAVTGSSSPMSLSQCQPYWTSIDGDIDAHLKHAIPIRSPLSVFEPMHRLTFSAPYTTAPALCIAACELVDGHRDQAMAAAAALRLTHAAAFVHEQLPLTDRPRPKNRPTIDHLFGPNIELLTGDGIAPFGFELLANSDDPTQNNSERILRVIIEIARATGAQGRIQGRYNELELEYVQSEDEKWSHLAWINEVCKKKEGEMHACAGACGAILGGGSEEEIEKLRSFGLHVGILQAIGSMVKRGEKAHMEVVSGLRRKALEELKAFNQEKIGPISSLVEPELLLSVK
ncbi:hypothetical protein K2173_010729 [Erythroxylum novogranatense]|uniref:Uncharacterized protein n=1 Tax=Erythroxylum novogranatense TaxID=1862640 RepID=A0AAV8SRP4_9ROSI|nr:hypothetical protein K2173_010729 [Erythroxylum novogranatense]